MFSRDDTDTLNKSFYLGGLAAEWWATKDSVMTEEQAFLDEFGDEVKGRKVLDIGIGGGRTTRFLLPLAGNYIGVDYSPDMIKKVASSFPGSRLEVRDARDLSAYRDGEFDFVLFSFNGMDCIAHEGRMQTMGEVHRVLKLGGLFVFSSHNRERPILKPYALKFLSLSKHPVRMLKYFLAYLDGIRSWRKSIAYAIDREEYALRHDSGNAFKAPMYYISKQAQAAQLERQGFALLAIYDRAGRKVTPPEPDDESPWFLYVCRRTR